jgi:hypothetical protein
MCTAAGGFPLELVPNLITRAPVDSLTLADGDESSILGTSMNQAKEPAALAQELVIVAPAECEW